MSTRTFDQAVAYVAYSAVVDFYNGNFVWNLDVEAARAMAFILRLSPDCILAEARDLADQTIRRDDMSPDEKVSHLKDLMGR